MKKVGILRGGTGEDYESSIKKGGDIISFLYENLSDSWKPADILIDKGGLWHINGVPLLASDLMHKVDMVWNTAEPDVSVTLQNFSIPNIGNGFFSSSLQNSREMLREHMKRIGVRMPRSIVLPVYQRDFDGPPEKYAVKKAKEVFEKFSSPWIVKSFTSHSNTGMHLAKTFPELVDAIDYALKREKSILVEEFIEGKVASVHSINGFRDEDVYIFPIGNTFGSFSSLEKEKLSGLARAIHDHVGARHYLKSNFIVNPKGKIYLTHIELLPDFKRDSHFSQSCELAGAKMHHVIEHILEQALN